MYSKYYNNYNKSLKQIFDHQSLKFKTSPATPEHEYQSKPA